jgi:hypothetical protein
LNPPPKGLLINSALWSAVAHPHSDLSFATAISLTMEQVRVWLAASAAAAMPDFRNPHRLYGTHAMSASGTALSAAFLSFVSQNTIPNTLQWLGTWHPVSREWTSQPTYQQGYHYVSETTGQRREKYNLVLDADSSEKTVLKLGGRLSKKEIKVQIKKKSLKYFILI